MDDIRRAPVRASLRRLIPVFLLLLPPARCFPALATQDLFAQPLPSLVAKLVGGGLMTSNTRYTGAQVAAGTFTGGTGIIGFEEGIVLSTGNVAAIVGPNASDNTTTVNGTPGDADLTAIVGATNDAALLEFDFVPCGNYLTFYYVFSSEEYNEYVGQAFNDVFAFFVNGVNVALLPGTSTPVSINNVNGGNPYGMGAKNPAYYINNDVSDGGGSINTEMDGLTVVLQAKAAVNSGVTNTFKIAIADATDSSLDSNVFIMAGSFRVESGLKGAVAAPAKSAVRQWITVTVTVTNTGGEAVTGVVPVLGGLPGMGTVVAGPVPSGPVDVNSGASRTFMWTYSVTGAGMLQFTATLTGTTCSVYPVSAVAGTSATAVEAARLGGAVTVSSTVVMLGDWVTVAMTVTNTGAVSAYTTAPSLAAVPALMQVIGGPSPASFPALAPGAGGTFLWTFSASGAGTLAFEGTAAGTDEYSGLPVISPALSSPDVLVPAPAELAAAAAVTPSLACAGQNLLVSVTVTNTGQVAASGVTVNGFVQSGTGSANPVAGPTPSMPVVVPGGGSITFTWTYTGASLGVVAFTATATGWDSNSGESLTTGPETSGAVSIGLPAVLEAAIAAPPAASVGQLITVTLTATNTGATPATGVTAALAVGPGAGGVLTGPSPAGPLTVGPGASQTFSWTANVAAAGPFVYTGTATGKACLVSTLEASDSASMTAVLPAALAGAVHVSSTTLVIGQWLTATMTVTNTGEAAALTVTPTLTPSAGALVLVNGPSPPAMASLDGGASATFAWTFSANGSGTASLAGGAAGLDVNAGWAAWTGALAGPPVRVLAPALLSARLVAAPSPRNVGQTFLLTLTVTNTGEEEALGVGVPAPWAQMSGSGSASYQAGPVPSFPVDLAGGVSLTFTWTYAGTVAGSVTFTTTLTATAAVTGKAAKAGPVVSNPALIQTPAALAGSAPAAWPGTVCAGSQVRIVMTVTNTGGATAMNVVPGDLFVEPAGQAVKVSSPGATTIVGGVSRSFTWVYSAAGPAAALRFTATIAGQDANDGSVLTTGPRTSNAVTVYVPAELSSALSVSRATVVAGEPVTVTMTVTNTGAAGAQDATGVALAVTAVPALADRVSGPPSAGPLTLPRGSSTTYEWVFATTGAGDLSFSGAATGNTCGGTISAPASAPLAVLPPARLVIDRVELEPATVNVGGRFDGVLVVRNAGGVSATLTGVTAAVGAGSMPGFHPASPLSPLPPVVVAPGAAQAFTWSHTTGGTGCGIGYVGVTVSGVEHVSGRALAAGPAGSNSVNVAAEPVRVALTPAQPEAQAGLPVALIARLADACDIGVPGRALLISVVSGGGSVMPFAGTTDISGEVPVTLTLGIDPGPNVVRVVLSSAGISGTALVTGRPHPLALDSPGAALSANVIAPRRGEVVLTRISPTGPGEIVVRIFTASGRLVRTLREHDFVKLGGGQWLATWDGKTEDDFVVARGVYLIHVKGPGINSVSKVVVK